MRSMQSTRRHPAWRVRLDIVGRGAHRLELRSKFRRQKTGVEQTTEVTTEKHDKSPSDDRDCSVHCPKLSGGHLFVEATDPADESVRNEQTHKGQSHQSGIHFGRRGARNQCEKGGLVVQEGDSQSSAVEEWPERMNRRGTRKEDCGYRDQVARSGKKGAGADLSQFVRLATSQCLLPPDPE